MVSKDDLNQGDIIRVDRIRPPVLIVSKDYFNHSGEVIGCPIYEKGEAGALHIYICTDRVSGYVQCEKMALLDMSVRIYVKLDRIHMSDIINITDAIQGIFDYV